MSSPPIPDPDAVGEFTCRCGRFRAQWWSKGTVGLPPIPTCPHCRIVIDKAAPMTDDPVLDLLVARAQ